jgi:hypothetical protein
MTSSMVHVTNPTPGSGNPNRGEGLAVAGGCGGGGCHGGWWRWVQPHSSTSFLALSVQFLPLLLLHPVRRVVCWTVFLVTWVHLENLLMLQWETETNCRDGGGGGSLGGDLGSLAGVLGGDLVGGGLDSTPPVPVVPDPIHRRLVSLMAALFVTAATRW